MQVAGEGSECRIVRKPLKNLGDVGYPERPFKAGFDLLKTLGK